MNSTEPQTNILDIRNLSVDYAAANGTVHAVDNVSLTLRRGEILGLAGESGSGKSTLAYAIARLLRPPALVTQGEVWYYPRGDKEVELVRQQTAGKGSEGEAGADTKINILAMTSRQLRAFRWSELAVVFQSAMNALNPVLNLETQLTDVLKAHNPAMSKEARRERAIELLRLVGISPDRLKSYPHELSGGMRQRSIIAIAMALSPDIIIMDEPTTALDVVVQRDILIQLLALQEQFHFSIIFITHDLSLLLEIVDRVAIMYAGRLVELATREDMLYHPRHPYTYGLLNSFPALRGPQRRMTGIPGSPPDLRALPSGCPFHPRCRFAFSSCPEIVPALRVAYPDAPQQRVACHLHDPQVYKGTVPRELLGVDEEPSDSPPERAENDTLPSEISEKPVIAQSNIIVE